MTWSDPVYETIALLVNGRTGLQFLPSRHDSAEAGIRRAMGKVKITHPERYLTRIRSDMAAFDDLISELTIGETYFFREPAHFDFIRREVLPEIRRRRGPEYGIRAWSSALASGEEAYSLAILFEQEGCANRAYLLATDISRTALARAGLAAYGSWSLRGSGAATARPYLTCRNAGDKEGSLPRFALDEKIRRRVRFEYLNLALDVYPSAVTNTCEMDLILCRNVLIYLDPRTVKSVATRLFESLAPGGWLFTASADPPLSVVPPWEVVVTNAGVFYRRSPASLPALPIPALPAIPESEWRKTDIAEPFAWDLPRSTGEPGPEIRTDPLTAARTALAHGDYARAAALTVDLLTDAETALLHVRALANVDTALAERTCAAVVSRHPLSTELLYLHAVLLLDLGREKEAILALRRVLYLDRTLAIAHFTLGSLLKQSGDRAGARRAYRNARDLCAARPAEEVVLLSEGEQAGRLAEACSYQLAILDSSGETPS